jgi:FAD/FMN-containing dehydrogenase
MLCVRVQVVSNILPFSLNSSPRLVSVPPDVALSSAEASRSSTAATTTVAYDPAAHRNTASLHWENWASTMQCVPDFFHTPASVAEIEAILNFARQNHHKVKIVGHGHSPNDIALPGAAHRADATKSISNAEFPGQAKHTLTHMVALGVNFGRVIEINSETRRATVEAGISLAHLNEALEAKGLALPMLGSISDQTLGGTLACGTHGTTLKRGAVLASCVVELELIDAMGTKWVCNAGSNADLFNAARVNLGALGVILLVTLQCVPAYDLIETTTVISFEKDLMNPQKFAEMTSVSNSDKEGGAHDGSEFVRFHWIPHTDKVVYTKMRKIAPNHGPSAAAAAAIQQQQLADGKLPPSVAAAVRDTDARVARARSSPLLGAWDKLIETKNNFLGYHALEAAYYLSSMGPTLQEVLVPTIAKVWAKLLFPPMRPEPTQAGNQAATKTPTKQEGKSRGASNGVGTAAAHTMEEGCCFFDVPRISLHSHSSRSSRPHP